MQATITFNPILFNQHATLYGNKTANLIELERITAELNALQPNKTFAVPPFFTVSSPSIRNYLQNIPYAETTVWDYILMQQRIFNDAQANNFESLTQPAQEALSRISNVLSNTFFDLDVLVSAYDPERLEQLHTFLQNAVMGNRLLTVRSSGQEDSQKISNAGGNKSITAVGLTREALSKAIAEVLASYVSVKSITQRLLAKDPNIFSPPFTAVLLQYVVGEIIGTGNAIPASGVIFSREAEAQTAHVVVIQATFGHNEGVVNGLVPVDSYYIGPSNVIHPLISIKARRLAIAPNRSELHFVDNDRTIRHASVLDPETILTLREAAQFIEHYYNNPVDIEFVIMGNTVYLVQVRPLEAKTLNPSFLTEQFVAHSKNNIIQAFPVGVGNAAVQSIDQPDQLIVAKTINQALIQLLSKIGHKDTVKAVIIQQAAPATSHEATQFRRLGIPVLYTQDINRITSQLERPITSNRGASSSAASSSQQDASRTIHRLLIDAQRECIVHYTPDDLFPTTESTIEQGWFAHPIAKKVSLMPEFIAKVDAVPDDLNPHEFFSGTPSSALLDIIKNGTATDARNALRSLLHRLLGTLRHTERDQKQLAEAEAETNEKLVNQLKRIYLGIITSAHEINLTLKDDATSRLERLYPITFLEALLRQIPEPSRLVHDYSFGSVLKTEQLEHQAVDQLTLQRAPARSYIAQYAKVSTYAFTPNVEHDWNRFIKELTAAPEGLQQQFAQLILQITDLNMLPLWLNTSFEQTYVQHKKNTASTLQALITTHNRIAPFLRHIQKKLHYFNNFPTGNFEDPTLFDALFHDLEQNITPLVRGPLFLPKLSNITGVGLIAAIQLMQAAVETVDTSIKALTGSTLYTDKQLQVEHFNSMLTIYFKMLQSWTLVPRLQTKLQTLLESSFVNINAYVNTIAKIFPADRSIAQLSASPRFNVGGATLGSKANWHRSTPDPLTLEDIFTLIHQNLLVVLSSLTEQSELAKIQAPKLVQEMKQFAETTMAITSDTGLHRPQLIGITYDKGLLSYHYNLPQRNHSSTFRISYNMQTHQATLSVAFFGQARTRWQLLGDTAFLIAKVTGFTLASPIEIDINRGLLSFTWGIHTQAQAQKALYYVQAMADYATGNFARAYRSDALLPVLSQIGNINLEHLIESLSEALAQHPGLLAYTSEITTLLGKEYPAIKQIYHTISELFPHLPAQQQLVVLDIIKKEISSIPSPIIADELLPLIAYALKTKSMDEDTIQLIIAALANNIDIQNMLNMLTPLVLSADSQLQKTGLTALIVLTVNTEKPLPAELVQFINEALMRFENSSDPAIQEPLLMLKQAAARRL